MTTTNDWNEKIIAEFRANAGAVGGRFRDMRLLLLHTTGARSGLPRVNPLACVEDGDRLVVIASKGGAPTHPDWYYNLVANPEVEVEYGPETFRARAAVAAEPQRTALYNRVAARYPVFERYRRETEREIPVIVLTPLP